MDTLSNVKLHTGSAMPVIGLGTWQMKGDIALTVKHALQIGYRMIDTSSDYGSHPGIAEGLIASKVPRQNVYIVTKVEESDDAYARVIQNLQELKLEYADLMLIHRPPTNGVGEELWAGLVRARQEGKVRDIGVSNYSTQQIHTLADTSGIMPVVNQIEWSPFAWSNEMWDFCRQNDIIIQSYSPLTRAERLDDGLLQEIAESHQKTPAQVVLRWHLQHGFVPLPKSDKPEHIEENIDIFDFELSPDDMSRLDGINEQYSSLADKPVYQQQEP